MTQVIKYSDFDVSEITGTKPSIRGGKDKLTAYLLYKNSPFLIKLPPLKAPFGVTSYNNGNGPTNNYSLNLSAKGGDVKGKTTAEEAQQHAEDIFNKLAELDTFMVSYGLQYSKEIFNKKYEVGKHEAVVEALFTSTIKTSEDKDGNPYPRRINTKIRSQYDEPDNPNVKVFQDSRKDLNNKDFTFDDLVNLVGKGSFVEAVIQPSLWFISGKFGVTWRLVQMKAHKQAGTGAPQESVFSDDEDASEDDNTNNTKEENSSNVVEEAEDSDEDDENNDEEVEEIQEV